MRDYGTASWDGGDPACDHKIPAGENDPKYGERKNENSSHTLRFNRTHCYKCGAKRIDRQIGIEETPEAFVENLVKVFREVKRVLRKDGTLWINIGDSYGRGYRSKFAGDKNRKSGLQQAVVDTGNYGIGSISKEKQLVGIPWRLAFALQDDGWILRQDIIWAKPNPMPESVRDRCTKAHEYIFLLSKKPSYYFDSTAIHEDGSTFTRKASGYKTEEYIQGHTSKTGGKNHKSGFADKDKVTVGRNKRDVWTIATLPYQDAHFATFPPKLVEIPILAGTSEKGCCPKCGKGWERIIERVDKGYDGSKYGERAVEATGGAIGGGTAKSTLGSSNGKLTGGTRTVGFRPACKCRAKEMYCGVCGFVIELWHENKTKHNADLQNVSETIQSRQPKKTILQPPLLQSAATETGGQEVHPVREGIQTIFSSHKMLRENLCGGLDGETPERKDGISGMGENDQGVHNGQNARAPDGSQNGICNETSSCNGEPFGEAFGAERNSPPQERESGGQPDRELDPHGQEGARWIQETNIRGDMPIMRKCLPNPQTCPHCRSQSFIERDALRHPIILDPFAGSGTTLAVAQGLGRNAIGFDLNEKYAQDIAAVRLETARTGMKAAEVRAGQKFMFEEE